MKNKKILGLIIFAVIIALLLVNPAIYTDIVNSYRLERSITNNNLKSEDIERFWDLSSHKANEILLEHGEELLELGFQREIIELEELNENGNLNHIIAEAYYQQWLHEATEDFAFLAPQHYLENADNLMGGKVDRYFMPFYIFRSGVNRDFYDRNDYVTDDYRAVYNEMLAREVASSISYFMETDVIYSGDSRLWWVPEDISITQDKKLAIKTFLEEFRVDNEDGFNRTVYYLEEYLEDLGLSQYYSEIGKKNIIQSKGQLLNIEGVPHLYIQGTKHDEEIENSKMGYHKINLDTSDSDFVQGSSEVVWRDDGKYAYIYDLRSERISDDYAEETEYAIELEIQIFNSDLKEVEAMHFELERLNTRVYWEGTELFIDEFDTRKVYHPDTGKLEEGIKFERILYGEDSGRVIIEGYDLAKGFAYYLSEGVLVYETDQIVIKDTLVITDNYILYQTLEDTGLYVYLINEEELNYIDTEAKVIAHDDNYLYVLNFMEDYLSVLAKMDLTGEIVQTYPHYNPYEIVGSKGSKFFRRGL